MTDVYPDFWYKLIRNYKQKRLIDFGLTIPYILGANSLIDDSFQLDKDSIETLLANIINSELDQVAVIQLCPNIYQYVVGLDRKDFCMRYLSKETSFSKSDGEKTLYITQNASGLGKTIEIVTERLVTEYNHCLEEQNFSWDNFKQLWRPFSDNEKKLIISSLD
ncbi:hypothetical protein [Spirosoma sp. KUDC1026]|uniref:hypothetical protein n=1 Tax=Spirosoma sp. KUDC1026 TaxID=2745947 RepID=UPI00159BBEAB|nr:hypothetical protein [Spirosoma sp. KUDC1026]QKZ12145.1 hypothetical protein HU175_05680 [Spirosoma sp. KUDC1026]